MVAFKAPRIAKNTKPGQFFNIKINDSYRPLLRRPFSAHKIGKDKIEILYKVVGKATRIFSTKKKSETLDIIGPLGNGFSFHPGAETVILVAGGHGIAPLVALAEELKTLPPSAGSRRSSPGEASYGKNAKCIVFIGAKTKKQIVCEKDFRKLGAKVCIATDDGSKGRKGLVTSLLEHKLQNKSYPPTPRLWRTGKSRVTIYACGPKPMLKAVAKLVKRYGIPAQISLEEYMACGIGTCLGCPVKTQQGFKLVCKDGPVFDAEEIIWT